MVRVQPLPPGKGNPLVRFGLRMAKHKLGRDTEPARVIARSMPVFAANAGYELAIEHVKALDHRLSELAVLKTASIVGCSFCLDIGSWMARDAGLTEEQVLGIHDHHGSGAFDATESLVCDYAEAMTATPPTVDAPLVAAVRERLGEQALVELTAMIAWENHRARFNDALGLEAAGFSSGAACALPQQHTAQVATPTPA